MTANQKRVETFLGILEAHGSVSEGKTAYYLACQLFDESDVRAAFKALISGGTLAISADWIDYSGPETESMKNLV